MSHPGWFAVSALTVLFFAWRTSVRVALPTRAARGAGFFVLVYANIVLTAEILGTLGLLHPQWFAAVHVALACVAAWAWSNASDVAAGLVPAREVPPPDDGGREGRGYMRSVARRHVALGLLATVIVITYGMNLALAVTLPPNNWDSMMYHLSRVAYWLQQDGFYPPWNPDHFMQMFHPANSELGILWTMIFCGTDRLAGAIQWLAAVITMVVIVGMARLLGYGRAAAVFAALMWASFPQILLQSTTTQTDVLTSAFFLTAIYCCLLGLQQQHRGALVVSGIALGLAFGTKTTAIVAFPAFVLGAAVVWWRTGQDRTLATTWLTACAIGIVLLGAQVYVANFILVGHPLGSADYRARFANAAGLDPAMLAANAFRVAYGLADLSGVPDVLAAPLLRVKVAAGHFLVHLLHIDPYLDSGAGPPLALFAFDAALRIHEDLSFFGPLGLLLLIPIVVWQGVRGVARGHINRIVLVGTAIWFVATMLVGVRWNPWLGRYLVLAATLCAPLLASCYRWRGIVWLLLPIAATVVVATLLSNEAKPLIGPSSIWGRDRVGLQSLTRPPIEPLLRIVEREVPPTARVGVILKYNDWDYPLFGERLTRHLVPLWPIPATLSEQDLAAHELDYVLVSADLGTDISTLAARHRSWSVPPWILIQK